MISCGQPEFNVRSHAFFTVHLNALPCTFTCITYIFPCCELGSMQVPRLAPHCRLSFPSCKTYKVHRKTYVHDCIDVENSMVFFSKFLRIIWRRLDIITVWLACKCMSVARKCTETCTERHANVHGSARNSTQKCTGVARKCMQVHANARKWHGRARKSACKCTQVHGKVHGSARDPACNCQSCVRRTVPSWRYLPSSRLQCQLRICLCMEIGLRKLLPQM